MTDGRMQMGGTSIRVKMRSTGRAMSGFIISSGMSCHKTVRVLTLTPLNKNLDTTPVLLNTISPSGSFQLNYFIDTDMFSKSCISFELLNLEQQILSSK